MKFDIGHLPQPEQGRQVVAEQVFAAGALVFAYLDGPHKVGHRMPPMLLVEVLAIDAVGIPAQAQRPVLQVRQQIRRHFGEVDQQIALGYVTMSVSRRPECLAQVSELDGVSLNLNVEGVLRVL